MEDKTKRVLYISLAGLLLGLLLFMFGITISKGSLFVDLCYYIMTTGLLACSFLALYNNREGNRSLFKYLMIISVFFEILITYFMISNHL